MLRELPMQSLPSKSIALGRGVAHAVARSPAEFEVEARNAAERPSKQGGDQIKVKFSAPANTTVANIEELPEGRYKVEYTAPIAGTYQLTVTMNGEHIVGSPFTVVVQTAAADGPPRHCGREKVGSESYSQPCAARQEKGATSAPARIRRCTTGR